MEGGGGCSLLQLNVVCWAIAELHLNWATKAQGSRLLMFQAWGGSEAAP